MALKDRIVHPGTNVLEEAKLRIRRCFARYDHVCVSFSGGKDSLVVLELTRLVMDELGMENRPVWVEFTDEELISDDVVRMVQGYYENPRFDVWWYAVPMKSQMQVLGELLPYIQWDPNREWVRPKPAWARTDLHPENKPLIQSEMSSLMFKNIKGSIAMLNGIRAAESLMRLQSSLRVRGESNWILRDVAPQVSFCRPIFDWTERDVFKFFFDHNIDYCDIYDKEMWAGAPLRVSTPLHSQAFMMLSRMRAMYPLFYQQLVSVFPKVDAHVRYWKDYDIRGVIDQYPPTIEGLLMCVDDHITNPSNRARAIQMIQRVHAGRESARRSGLYTPENCYGYPLLKVFKMLVKGGYDKGVQVHAVATDEERRFEGIGLEGDGGGIGSPAGDGEPDAVRAESVPVPRVRSRLRERSPRSTDSEGSGRSA